MNLSRERRADTFSALQQGVDTLVIGGGINGAGVFRDAALRNLRAGLVEMNDFGSGTSSRSSKLIHGGVRYLEHLDFGLVLESSLERTLLMRLLPDLVQPAPFLIPIYRDSPHGLFTMDLGLWLYDALAFFRNFHLHRRLNPREVAARLPGLEQKGLTGGVLYYDCRVNDARLVINNIVSGCANNGQAVNYAEAVEVKKEKGGAAAVIVRDRLTGKTVEVPCRTLVSAAGPWTNGLFAKTEGTGKDLLRLTKGIHLLFPQKRFKTVTAAVITSKDDRRIVFIIPWEEYTLVGTTDTDFNGDLNSVCADASDVAYLLDLVNSYFPGLSLRPEEAISAFAGLRPLVLAKGSASAVSRKDRIIRSPSGIYFICGGKLTTYRHIAQKAVDRLLRDLPRETQRNARACRTAEEPLIEKPEALSGTRLNKSFKANLDPDIFDYLFARYGKGAAGVMEIAASEERLSRRIAPQLPFIFAEIPYGAENEMLLSVTDFFRLRTEIYLKSPDNGLSRLDEAADVLGQALGLDARAKEGQKEEYRVFLKQNLGCLNKNVQA